MSQSTFFFDAPLTEMPVSQIPLKPVIPASIPTESEAFVQAALVVLETIADGFDTDDVLDIMGVPKLARVGWHRSRVLEAIKQPSDNPYGSSPYGEYQVYRDGTNIRYRSLLPYEPCVPAFHTSGLSQSQSHQRHMSGTTVFIDQNGV